MPKVRAKFVVTLISEADGFIRMEPVILGSPENEAFWEATPAGSLEMTITNRKALEHFTEGQEFYLDFTPAEEAAEPSTD